MNKAKTVSTKRLSPTAGANHCKNCGEGRAAHCKECNACPDQHAGYCSKDRS